ncbi:hypothetical protein RRF68_03470 [Tenacibaculum sp. HL-MS23]|uniref:HYC_CC_PP family protein n=1 Tax=Tenacibaculum sp. HL-MS23 TaxID=3077734 RepID=UPI0028FC288B|nr:hypothetical protein [Tenacibaculum sp. HL-MS23]WNW02498.1 hypothetical protein RRF68_03470 [Tenacibaculum sp. HL-MS23]
MKKILHKTISFLMALVVLLSTMSFIIDMHFCGDTLVDTALFRKAKTCGMKMQKAPIKECSITKKNCCNDKQIAFEGKDNLQASFNSLSFEQQQFITSFLYTYINLFKGFNNNISPFKTYKPPLVTKELFKLDETYLI